MTAKFPSLQSVLNAVQKTISRFPLETITTILGTVFAILLLEEKNDAQEKLYVKLIMCCSLCLALFLSVSLYFLATQKSNWVRFLTSLILGGLVTAFVFSFAEKITEVEIIQFLALNIALHLLVSFAGFLPKSYDQDEFWEFNKQLFLRILTAGLYSLVLYAGLALAILAVHNLFNVEFYNNIYPHLFFVIAGVFNTIFFLAGVPETNDKEVPLTLNYPKGLKKFTQYVLLPLISIYLVILICYEAKILVTLSLPVGWVSNLVLVFAIFGILSFLLVHPIAEETGNLWMRTFNRWFYYLLIPLLGLLFWAILYRIHLYGFTHERYYVFILAIWLTIVVAYFLIQKQPKIKFIPISLCIIALLSLVGPQSADSVSKRSQLSRFESYMQKIEKSKLKFTKEEQDLKSIVDFLIHNYGVEIMKPHAKSKLDALLKKDKKPDSDKIMNALVGSNPYSQYANIALEESKEYQYGNWGDWNLDTNSNKIENIHNYDLSVFIDKDGIELQDSLKIGNKHYLIKTKDKDYGSDISINNDIISIKVNDFVKRNEVFLKINQNKNKRKVNQIIKSDKYDVLATYLYIRGKQYDTGALITEYKIKVKIRIK
jgi:hypothetical protein